MTITKILVSLTFGALLFAADEAKKPEPAKPEPAKIVLKKADQDMFVKAYGELKQAEVRALRAENESLRATNDMREKNTLITALMQQLQKDYKCEPCSLDLTTFELKKQEQKGGAVESK